MIGHGPYGAPAGKLSTSQWIYLFTIPSIINIVIFCSGLLLFLLFPSVAIRLVPILLSAMIPRRHVATLLRAPARPSTVRSFSTTLSARLELAYDLHEPPKESEKHGPRGNAIIFAHGLFGSKKNNRSMSK